MAISKLNFGVWDLIDTVLPSFERTRLTDEVERVFKDLQEITKPVYDINDETIERTSAYKLLDGTISRKAGKLYKGKTVEYIRELTALTLNGKEDLIKLIEKSFGKKVTKEGLDYKRGHLLHLVSLLEFFNTYAIRFLLTATKEVLNDKYAPVDTRSKFFVEDADNIRKFASIANALELEFKNYSKLMIKIEGISMDPDTRDVSESVLGEDADPLSVGFYTVDFNPFYLVGKMFNQVYVFLFDIKREEAAKLELHVAKLEQKRLEASGDSLAAIDKAIAYHSDRLNRLDAEISEVIADASDL